ncbi:helix-turn-helix transcriptional regulator [Fluviicola taffensis]|uniref:DeoR family transcriptional regulator n=1 Tax=Fluviicola taffensis (strain DSM 16823 / NCIMB 13979 / RW262) TaxID=755732 RepID=F2IIF4_FLUTR|nr:YafY family protein [Fluviicola taffensis]AEA44880.1 DeoR family transcriptional regulator [Fluviicola taffensis DSM 16823]
MNRVDRLFGIVTLLQSRKHVPAERISEKFEISIRTVYRDIKAIGEAGIPVSFEVNKGYFIVPGYFTPPVSFTLEEANALLLSQSLIGGFGDRSVQSTFDSALTKIRAVLKQVDKEKLALLDQSIKLQLPQQLNSEFEYLSKVQQAITEQHQLKISYASLKEETLERTVEPIGLVFYAFSWHIIAYCHLRKDYRDFKIKRIQTLHKTNLPFEISSHIPLSEYKLPVNY